MGVGKCAAQATAAVWESLLGCRVEPIAANGSLCEGGFEPSVGWQGAVEPFQTIPVRGRVLCTVRRWPHEMGLLINPRRQGLGRCAAERAKGAHDDEDGCAL